MGQLIAASWRFIKDHCHEPIVLANGAVCRHCGLQMTTAHAVLPFRKVS